MFNLELLDKEKLYKIIKIRKEKVQHDYVDYRLCKQDCEWEFTYDDIVRMLNDGSIYNPFEIDNSFVYINTEEGDPINDLRNFDISDIICVRNPHSKLYIVNNRMVLSYILNDQGKIVQSISSPIGPYINRKYYKYDDIGREIEVKLIYSAEGTVDQSFSIVTEYSNEELSSISKWVNFDGNGYQEKTFWYTGFDKKSHSTIVDKDGNFVEFRMYRYDVNDADEFISITEMI